MSEEATQAAQDEPTTDAPDQDLPELRGVEYLEPDPTLTLLQRLATRGLGLPVTLTVGGQILVGSLANGRDFWEGQATFLDELPISDPDGAPMDRPEVLTEVVRHFRLIADDYPPFDDPETQPAATVFVHLKNVTFVGGRREATMPWWRGRLSDVEGWALGGVTFS